MFGREDQEGRDALHGGGEILCLVLMPNVVAGALDGVLPMIDLILGYNEANASPLLRRFLSRIDEMAANVENQSIIRYAGAL